MLDKDQWQTEVPSCCWRCVLFALWNMFDLRAVCFFCFFVFLFMGGDASVPLCSRPHFSHWTASLIQLLSQAREEDIWVYDSGLKGQKQAASPFLECVKKRKFNSHLPLGCFVTLPPFQKYCLLSVSIHFFLPYPVPSIYRTTLRNLVVSKNTVINCSLCILS